MAGWDSHWPKSCTSDPTSEEVVLKLLDDLSSVVSKAMELREAKSCPGWGTGRSQREMLFETDLRGFMRVVLAGRGGLSRAETHGMHGEGGECFGVAGTEVGK